MAAVIISVDAPSDRDAIVRAIITPPGHVIIGECSSPRVLASYVDMVVIVPHAAPTFDQIVDEIKAERRAKRRGIVPPAVVRPPAPTGPAAVHETWFCRMVIAAPRGD